MKNDRAIEAFRNSIKNSEETDDIKKVDNAMREMNKEILKSFPLELRINCILGLISKANAEGKDSKIDFTVINEILHSNIGPYDYNLIPHIKSVEDISNLRDNILTATFLNGPWRKRHCKKCNEDFYLTFGQVQFYKEKGFPLPKQCEYCKKGIEKPKKEVPNNKKEELEDLPSAMEVALKKAGF